MICALPLFVLCLSLLRPTAFTSAWPYRGCSAKPWQRKIDLIRRSHITHEMGCAIATATGHRIKASGAVPGKIQMRDRIQAVSEPRRCLGFYRLPAQGCTERVRPKRNLSTAT
ncbi:hypothetical protein B0T22DRAFT_18126 [Podospora appendiculata]|uniref:Secreted protein n=1 Tax=Podospora appendiculata TaxID=314037 RepID=A0AAE0XFU6_9PEZI|nr:hypothetical protein B0T22DRAFT_18126 [Podospora appendiculata]